jgi:hypothetical protein
MKRGICLLLVVMAMMVGSGSSAQEDPKVGGYEQYPPGPLTDEQIGAGWGHRSMAFGMMNMMSGMTTQIADIVRTGKATPEMNERLGEILDHLAEMMNDAPAYMMGTKVVDRSHMDDMALMQRDLEKMHKETDL